MKFVDFIRGIEAEAEAEGPEAVEQITNFRSHFSIVRKLAEARLKKMKRQHDLLNTLVMVLWIFSLITVVAVFVGSFVVAWHFVAKFW